MSAAEGHDLVIAGGGPAGLMTAIQAQLAGLDALVLDAANPPIDRACGEGLMPDGVELLKDCGVDLASIETYPFDGVRYLDGDSIAEGRFRKGCGAGVRRPILHEALRERAEILGADLRWGVRVSGLTADGFETENGPFNGRWLVAADGRTSRIRRWAGLEGRPTRHRRFGVRRHFALRPWTDLVEVYWTDGCEAYVTPVGQREVGVAILWSGGASRFDDLLSRFPSLADRLAGAAVTSRDRGAGPLEQRCRRPVSGRLALVGDAAGYLDPITGEGLSLAFQQAAAVVLAIQADDLSLYRVAHRRIIRFPAAVIRLLLLVERSPRLRRRVMQTFATRKQLMSRFLDLKTAAGGPRFWGAEGLVRLVAETLMGGSRPSSTH